MRLIKHFWVLSCCLPFSLSAQTIESGDIFDKVSTIISNMPDANTNEYADPMNAELADWVALLDDLFAANYSSADTKADALGYDLVEFSDNTTNETYYVLEKLGNGTNYWGTYILNPSAAKEQVILMAPHPKFDFNTGKQAIFCFKDVDAGFFMMSGAHRCNRNVNSSCSGMTEVCGSAGPFKISDLAHTVTSVWQTTTSYLLGTVPDPYFIQLHGFTMGGNDPYVIMSNGTRETPFPDPVTAIRNELLVVDPMLTFEIAHLNHNWDRLVGFTNTNGREINASNNSCTTSATVTDGRFVHIEQEKTSLRNDQSGWQKMATAIDESFPLSLLPVDWLSFELEQIEEEIWLNWTVASERNNAYFEIEKSRDGQSFWSIGEVAGQGNSDFSKTYQFMDRPHWGNNYYRIRQVDYDGEVSFSPIQKIYNDLKENHLVELRVLNDQIVVWLDEDDAIGFEIQLFDPLGRLLLKSPLAGGENMIPKWSLNNGLCFYQITNREGLRDAGLLSLK